MCRSQTPLFTYVLYLIVVFTLGLMLQEMRSVYYLGIENVRTGRSSRVPRT